MSEIKKLELDVELADGRVLRIRPQNPSRVAWDKTRAVQVPKWPTADEAPFMFLTFLAFHHLRYALKEIECSFDDFQNDLCVDIEAVDSDESTDPTQPDLSGSPIT